MSGASGLSEGEFDALLTFFGHDYEMGEAEAFDWARDLEPVVIRILAAREAAWRGERDGLRARVEAIQALCFGWALRTRPEHEPEVVIARIAVEAAKALEPAAERPSAASEASGGVVAPQPIYDREDGPEAFVPSRHNGGVLLEAMARLERNHTGPEQDAYAWPRSEEQR